MCLQLNDLMIMAVKYQVFLCKRPQDLLLITLNHVDEIRKFLHGDSHATDLLDHSYSLLFSVRNHSVAEIFTSCLLTVGTHGCGVAESAGLANASDGFSPSSFFQPHYLVHQFPVLIG